MPSVCSMSKRRHRAPSSIWVETTRAGSRCRRADGRLPGTSRRLRGDLRPVLPTTSAARGRHWRRRPGGKTSAGSWASCRRQHSLRRRSGSINQQDSIFNHCPPAASVAIRNKPLLSSSSSEIHVLGDIKGGPKLQGHIITMRYGSNSIQTNSTTNVKQTKMCVSTHSEHDRS